MYIAVILIGALVGAGEIVSRYKDAPGTALRLTSAWLYVLLNGAAAWLALYISRAMGWTFGGNTTDQQAVFQVLVAGFGAMVFLRSSLFTVRIGETEVGIGPSAMLTALMAAADRNIDRARARSRLQTSTEIMRNFNAQRDYAALITLVCSAMQNATTDESSAITTAATALMTGAMSERHKADALGLILLNLAGEELLRQAVNSMDDK